MNKNHFALNMVTKGVANPKSLITKGIILPYSYEIHKGGEVIRRGGGMPNGEEIKDFIRDNNPDLIKVFVRWDKKKQKHKKVTVELIKQEITVELLESLGVSINVDVEFLD